ncbi:MAG: DUF3853 family protein [Bacteroidales bacterium]
MNLHDLKLKPLWQMTGEEFLFLQNNSKTAATTDRQIVYGIRGIAQLFGCSMPTANRIKKSGIIDNAITQVGRKIIVDAKLALELAGQATGGRK